MSTLDTPVRWLTKDIRKLRLGLSRTDSGLVVVIQPGPELRGLPQVAVADLGVTTFQPPTDTVRIERDTDEDGQVLSQQPVCPACGNGELIYQEYVYTCWRLADEPLQQREHGPVLAFYGHAETPYEIGLTSVLAPVHCRGCGAQLAPPPGHTIDWA
jgi:hypothetical protein